MAYTRTYTVDSSPGGDTVKAAVATKLDGDLTNAFTYLNAHDIATTSVHGFTGAKTGSGAMVGATSPTLVTPILGVATATSINKVAITAPATAATLTISDGKTFSCSGTLTLSGTDGSTLNIGTGGTLGTAAYTAATAYEASGAVSSHAALLTGVHGLAITAGQTLTVTTGGTLGTAAYTAATAYDAAGAAAAVTPTTLGLVIGTNVQAYNSNLTAINQALTTTSSPSFTTVTAALTGVASGNALLAASISDGDTTHSPDGNSVFDALALKAPLSGATLVSATVNALTLTAAATGFTISGGTTPKTLTVEDTSLVNQDLTSDASPTFVTAKLTGLTNLKVPKHVADTTGLADTAIDVTANNEMTNASQPAFLAIPTAEQSDISINTPVTVVFGTEIFDQNADFASNTFTAPVTGKYQLNASVWLLNLDSAATYYEIAIVTSNRTYQLLFSPDKFSGDLAYWGFNLSHLVDMDAGDTAYVTIRQQGGTQQADVSATGTAFSGALFC